MPKETEAQLHTVTFFTSEEKFVKASKMAVFQVVGLSYCREHKVGVMIYTDMPEGSEVSMECALQTLIDLASGWDEEMGDE